MVIRGQPPGRTNQIAVPVGGMFRLSAQETAALTFQIGISKPRGRGGRHALQPVAQPAGHSGEHHYGLTGFLGR